MPPLCCCVDSQNATIWKNYCHSPTSNLTYNPLFLFAFTLVSSLQALYACSTPCFLFCLQHGSATDWPVIVTTAFWVIFDVSVWMKTFLAVSGLWEHTQKETKAWIKCISHLLMGPTVHDGVRKGHQTMEQHGGLQQCQCYGSTWNTPSAGLETMALHEETAQAPYSLCVSVWD